jgi:hypothetical protein
MRSSATLHEDGPRRQHVRDHLESTTGAEPPPLARKPNYSFEKRKKELDRKAKKDAKREDRRRRREEGQPEDGDVPGLPAPPEDPSQPMIDSPGG